MTAAPSAPPALPRLRPEPWPVTPFGPYRLAPGGGNKLVKFPTIGERVIKWIERNCVFTDGKWERQPVRLLPWQKQLLIDLFEMVWDAELKRWRRRYRTAFIGVPKKQGKTELAAFLGLWFLLGSGESAPGVAVAASADYQADWVFKAACRCAEWSPTISPVIQVFQREIQVLGKPNARMRKFAAAGGKLDGMKMVAAIKDEVHEWLTPNQRKVFGMLRGALALADEPMDLSITTAGEDDGEQDEEAVAPWLRMYRYGKLLESGEVTDDAFFFRWWASPAGTEARDIGAIKRCNPSFGVTVREAFYLDEFSKRTTSELLRYYHNLPVETLNIWLEHGTWEACRVDRFELDPSAPSWLGWDASTKRDSTGVVVVQRVEGRLRVKRWSWERPIGPGGEPVKDWKVPRNEVLAKVRELYGSLNIVAGGYDPHAIAWVAEDLENEGLALFEWPQTDQHMCPATQGLYEAIIDGVLAHDGDPVLERHIKAAKVKNTPRGGQRLVKSDSGRKIDCAIALVIAIGVMEKRPDPVPGFSLYVPGDEDN